MNIAVLTSLFLAAKLNVVATVPDLASIAQEVGGENIEVASLSLGTQDPHFVDARPHLALALAKADLLLAVGLELEIGWLPPLQTGSRNGKIQPGGTGYLDCSQFVKLLEVSQEKIDRSMGDIHPGGNPHYLYAPQAAGAVAQGIAQKLGELDPDNKKIYAQNLARFHTKLEEFRVGAETKLAGLRGAKVIAHHKTLPYLSNWLGLKVVEYIEPRPGIPPNPAHVARVLSRAKSEGVRAVLLESYYPETTARLLAEKSGALLVRLPGGTDLKAGKTYLDRLAEMVRALEAIAVKGRAL